MDRRRALLVCVEHTIRYVTLHDLLFQSGTFNWDMKIQGLVLGAFFYGYTTTQILGGTLAQKIGGKILMCFGVCWTAALTLLTPPLTNAGGYIALFILRFLEGMGEVCKFSPASYIIISSFVQSHVFSAVCQGSKNLFFF